MQKSFVSVVTILVAAMTLPPTLQAQQTPGTKTPAAKSPATQAARTRHTVAAKRAAPLALTTQKDKFSYALGMNLGTNLHKQSVPVDPNILLRGLKDALAGGKTALTEEQARAALTEVQTEMRKKQEEQMKMAGDASKKEGEAFLAANKSQRGCGHPAQRSAIQDPDGRSPAQSPPPADSVVCNYRGTLINGTEFDSSYKRGEPATFPVTGVIKGWTEALQLMPVGSKWQLFVPSDLAYGERAPAPEIGPNSTLIFEVELLSIQNKK